jgi:hypothetical protein
MYIQDMRVSTEDATVWIEQDLNGAWLPVKKKAIDYLKWFHDGVINKKDAGMFSI